MAFKRIALAYCVQLDRVISIASARREYFSQAEPRKRFDFLCSSEACRAQGIKVSASNYDKLPQGAKIELAPDVAEVFPTAKAVNEALRLLIRIGKKARG